MIPRTMLPESRKISNSAKRWALWALNNAAAQAAVDADDERLEALKEAITFIQES